MSHQQNWVRTSTGAPFCNFSFLFHFPTEKFVPTTHSWKQARSAWNFNTLGVQNGRNVRFNFFEIRPTVETLKPVGMRPSVRGRLPRCSVFVPPTVWEIWTCRHSSRCGSAKCLSDRAWHEYTAARQAATDRRRPARSRRPRCSVLGTTKTQLLPVRNCWI